MRHFAAFVCIALSVFAIALPQSGKAQERPPVRILVLGDSIASGYGLASARYAMPNLLKTMLEESREGSAKIEMINAGVAGDTTAGGLARIRDVIAQKPHIVIVALGANDVLRGIEPAVIYNNLEQILATLQRNNCYVLLAGMKAPPSQGLEYGTQVIDAYHRLTEKNSVVFVPFLLEGVAGVASLNQQDGVHPNEDGAQKVAENLFPALERMVRRVKDQM